MSDESPEFGAPPVVEVVAGVAFAPANAEAYAAVSGFWVQEARVSYPKLQLQPPYAMPLEVFGVRPRSTADLSLSTVPPVPRLWALSEDEGELLQLQPNYFACNWRKVTPNTEYDRWESRRLAFEQWFGRFAAFVESVAAQQVRPSQCEVTYINHVRAGQRWSSHSELEKVLTLTTPTSTHFDQAAIQADYVFPADAGTQGRLHVRVFPATELDGKSPLYVMELTARGAPRGHGIADVLTFLDAGRREINKTFTTITTPEMQEEWGRTE